MQFWPFLGSALVAREAPPTLSHGLMSLGHLLERVKNGDRFAHRLAQVNLDQSSILIIALINGQTH